jgi:hypothetical protein
MGFWHTGYMEFHEPVGLGDYVVEPRPVQYLCGSCGKTYADEASLREHRLVQHPLKRPMLYVRGMEVGAAPLRVRTPIDAGAVLTMSAEGAHYDGSVLAVDGVPRAIAGARNGIHSLRLLAGGSWYDFEIDVRIPSLSDLAGVDEEFTKLARGKYMDARRIQDFIDSSRDYPSAIEYCDGIAAYLFGVLARERAESSGIPYEAYVGKFHSAVESLSEFPRAISRAICGYIEFHFNHFETASTLSGSGYIGAAARRYQGWLTARAFGFGRRVPFSPSEPDLDRWMTDSETDQIAKCATMPEGEMTRSIAQLEKLLSSEIVSFDSAKIRILLTHVYSRVKQKDKALKHVRQLRNLPGFEEWADRAIASLAS